MTLKNLWNSYKYRFVPWQAVNLFRRNKVVTGKQRIVEDIHLVNQIVSLFGQYENIDVVDRHRINIKSLGFTLAVRQSQIPAGGLGVFVEAGHIPVNTFLAFYPGTIYLPSEPILFQSINNQFVFRCKDGILVDGNNRGLSKVIFRSCCGRERHGPFAAADDSWLTRDYHCPLNVGQIINNHNHEFPANVAYQELDLPGELPLKFRKYVPNVFFSSNVSDEPRSLRTVVLISLRRIEVKEELFSSYFTAFQE